jgi:hypothetical protein
MPAGLLVIAALVVAVDGVSQDGYIGGVVVNSSRDEQPVAGAKVVLEMKSDGDFVLLDETITDAAGRFLFRNLLVSEHIQYKPSAQFEGIHYPGARILFARERNTAAVTLAVRDIVREPNPLLVKDHEIYIRSTTGMLEVTESLVIENPLPQTYVGAAPDSEEDKPVTLQLSIPTEFQKVTFHNEFFGRSFAIRDGKLVTSVPWEPGKRPLKFTYYLRNAQQQRLWERTLDLPTDALRVRVATSAPDRVTGNLDRRATTQCAGYSEVLFTSGSMQLPAQYVVRCALGALRVPWTTYGKWCATLVLLALIASGCIAHRRRRTAIARRVSDARGNAALPRPHARTSSRGKRRTNKNLRRAA